MTSWPPGHPRNIRTSAIRKGPTYSPHGTQMQVNGDGSCLIWAIFTALCAMEKGNWKHPAQRSAPSSTDIMKEQRLRKEILAFLSETSGPGRDCRGPTTIEEILARNLTKGVVYVGYPTNRTIGTWGSYLGSTEQTAISQILGITITSWNKLQPGIGVSTSPHNKTRSSKYLTTVELDDSIHIEWNGKGGTAGHWTPWVHQQSGSSKLVPEWLRDTPTGPPLTRPITTTQASLDQHTLPTLTTTTLQKPKHSLPPNKQKSNRHSISYSFKAPRIHRAQFPTYTRATPIDIPVAYPLPRAHVVNQPEIDPRIVIRATLRALGRPIPPPTMRYIDSLNRTSDEILTDDINQRKKRSASMMQVPFDTDPTTRSMIARYGKPTTRKRRTTRWNCITHPIFSHMSRSPIQSPNDFEHDTSVT